MNGYTVRRFTPERRWIVESLNRSRQKNNVHYTFEVDMTETLARFAAIQKRTRRAISMTAYMVYVLGQLAGKHPILRTLRKGRSGVCEFGNADILVAFEKADHTGTRQLQYEVLRSVDAMSATAVVESMRALLKRKEVTRGSQRPGLRSTWLPWFLRRLVFHRVLADPVKANRMRGTLAVTSVGFFGPPIPSYGLPLVPHTGCLTIGSVYKRPRLIDGSLQDRDFLYLTATVDHDLIDGAVGVRLVKELCEMLQEGSGVADMEASAASRVLAERG